MKKLAKLTALLLTGVMLLLLASCGAAPNPGGSSGLTAAEAKARQEIINAIDAVRKDKGLPSLQEVPALTQLEQEFVEHFREAGTKGIPLSEAEQFRQELGNKQKKAGWHLGGGIYHDSSKDPAKLVNVYEGNTEAFRKTLSGWSFLSNADASDALSIGVVTIGGKIYWTISILEK